MAAFVELVVVDELGIRPLRPAPRGLIELVGKDAHGNRDGDVLGAKKRELVLPVEAGRGDRRVRQPEERDVVEHVVSREALRACPSKARAISSQAARRRGRSSRPPGRRVNPRSRTAFAGASPSRARSPAPACRRRPAARTRVARRRRDRMAAGRRTASALSMSGGTAPGMLV